jgi:hypothetical protein
MTGNCYFNSYFPFRRIWLEVFRNLAIFKNMLSSIEKFIPRIEDENMVIAERHGFSERAIFDVKNLNIIYYTADWL